MSGDGDDDVKGLLLLPLVYSNELVLDCVVSVVAVVGCIDGDCED